MRIAIFSLLIISGTLPSFSQTMDPYLAARACMAQEKYDSALVFLNSAADQDPGDVDVLYHRGLCYFKELNFRKAYEDFLQVEKKKKGMASFYLAKTEVHLKHPEQAVKYLRIPLSSRYKLPEKQILLDEDLASLEKRSDWRALWNEKNWYNQNDRDFQEAVFLSNHGSYLDAINILNYLEKRKFRKTDVHKMKAELFSELGNERASMSEINSAVESDVRNHAALQMRADKFREAEKYEEALNDYNKLLRLDPASFEAYLSRATSKNETGDLEGALEDVDIYLLYFPERDTAWFVKGQIQYRHKKYLDALQSMNKALDMNKGEPAYYHYRGLIYANRSGTLQYAEKDFSMALDLDPLNGETWMQKGKVASRLGKPETACHDYKKAYQYGIHEARDFIDKHCLGNE